MKKLIILITLFVVQFSYGQEEKIRLYNDCEDQTKYNAAQSYLLKDKIFKFLADTLKYGMLSSANVWMSTIQHSSGTDTILALGVEGQSKKKSVAIVMYTRNNTHYYSVWEAKNKRLDRITEFKIDTSKLINRKIGEVKKVLKCMKSELKSNGKKEVKAMVKACARSIREIIKAKGIEQNLGDIKDYKTTLKNYLIEYLNCMGKEVGSDFTKYLDMCIEKATAK
ncbi:MAG: hypothetical protein SFY56_14210 [Bacteroidota bacterium]|nr:hypothetical protein [Bacteroidota bacterium]